MTPQVDITGQGVKIDNKEEPTLNAQSTLEDIVNCLNSTRKGLNLVVGAPLFNPTMQTKMAQDANAEAAEIKAADPATYVRA